MNIEQLKEKIGSIAQMDEIGLNMYFLLKIADDVNLLKRANIIEDVKEGLISSYKNMLNEIASNEDLVLINLSAADDRNNAIYIYDLENKPSVLNFFDSLPNNQNQEPPDYFSFEEDSLSNLEGYFVRIGDHENNLLFYRKQMPINLFKRGKIYLIKGHETQFESINQEFLRIDTKIDIIKIGESIYINNVSILERHYEFKYIIENEANTSLENIKNLEILENIDVLQERVSDTTFARKLSKISTDSPVFNLPVERIMKFVTNHRVLGNEFRYNEDRSKILLDTKKSQNFFLKLMNDDFLHSELTNYDYLTPAKDRLIAEN